MQWYNSITNELQSNAPWGASYIHPDLIAEIYSDWVQVADSFTIIPTDTEILASTKATKLVEIKALLAETDYKCLKFADGSLTEEQYATTREERSALRVAYNTIEAATTLDEVNSITY